MFLRSSAKQLLTPINIRRLIHFSGRDTVWYRKTRRLQVVSPTSLFIKPNWITFARLVREKGSLLSINRPGKSAIGTVASQSQPTTNETVIRLSGVETNALNQAVSYVTIAENALSVTFSDTHTDRSGGFFAEVLIEAKTGSQCCAQSNAYNSGYFLIHTGS